MSATKLVNMKVSELTNERPPKIRIICDGTWCYCCGSISTTPYGAYKEYMISLSMAKQIGSEVFRNMDWSWN